METNMKITGAGGKEYVAGLTDNAVLDLAQAVSESAREAITYAIYSGAPNLARAQLRAQLITLGKEYGAGLTDRAVLDLAQKGSKSAREAITDAVNTGAPNLARAQLRAQLASL